MAKPELGNKHMCHNCGAKFFDLLAGKPVCPSCNTLVVIATPTKRRGQSQAEKPAVEAKKTTAKKNGTDGDGDDDLIGEDLDIDDDDEEDDDFVDLDNDNEDDLEAIVADDKSAPKIDDE